MGEQTQIYLDNNATTPLDPRVVEAILPTYREHFGNPSSVHHAFGWYSAELVQIAREQVAELIGASPEEIIFTSGATEANNLVLFGVMHALGKTIDKSGCHIVSTPIEHRSVLDPLRELEAQGFSVTYVPVNSAGIVHVEDVCKALQSNTRFVAVMLANNEIGSIQPIAELGKELRQRGVAFFSDATQAIGKIEVDVDCLGVDYLTLSAHKFYGPKGVGALYVRKNSLKPMPLLLGGGQESSLRSGTLNVHGIVGMGAAAKLMREDFLEHRSILEKHARVFLEMIRNGIPDVEINGPIERRLPGNLNLRIPAVLSSALIGALQTEIAFSAASACQSNSSLPSHVLAALGLTPEAQRESVRFGLGKYNSEDELRHAAQRISDVTRELRKRGVSST